MANAIDYTKVNWKDFPNTETPVNAANLNKMDKGIDDLNAVATALQTTTADHQSRIQTLEGKNLDSRISTLEGGNFDSRIRSIESDYVNSSEYSMTAANLDRRIRSIEDNYVGKTTYNSFTDYVIQKFQEHGW